MGKVFRLNTINSDLTEASALIDYVLTDSEGQPLQDREGQPVMFKLRPIAERHRYDVERKHTKRTPGGNGFPPSEKTDWDAYRNELTDYAIVSWTGVIGADDKPLPCVYEAKMALQPVQKNDVIKRATEGEAVDDSFRPSA